MDSLGSGELQEQTVLLLRRIKPANSSLLEQKALNYFFFLPLSFNVTATELILLIDQATHLPSKNKWKLLNCCQILRIISCKGISVQPSHLSLLSPTRLYALGRLYVFVLLTRVLLMFEIELAFNILNLWMRIF